MSGTTVTLQMTPSAFGAATPGTAACGDFVFSELSFTAPSSLQPVYLVFVAALPWGDLMYCAWHVPTIPTCQPDQTRAAYLALGLPVPGDLSPPTPIGVQPPMSAAGAAAFDAAVWQALGGQQPLPCSQQVPAAAAAASSGTAMPGTTPPDRWSPAAAGAAPARDPLESYLDELLSWAPGAAGCSASAPAASAAMAADLQVQMQLQLQRAASQPDPFSDWLDGVLASRSASALRLAPPGQGHLQTLGSAAPANGGWPGVGTPFGEPSAPWVAAAGGEPRPALPPGQVLAQLQPQEPRPDQVQCQPPPQTGAPAARPLQPSLRNGLAGGATGHGASSHRPVTGCGRGGRAAPQALQITRAHSAPAAPQRATSGPPSPADAVPRPPTHAALRTLLLQSYAALGLRRQLSEADLEALEAAAGFPPPPAAPPPPQGQRQRPRRQQKHDKPQHDHSASDRSAGSDSSCTTAAAAALAAAAAPAAEASVWGAFISAWVQTLSLLRVVQKLWDTVDPATPVAGLNCTRAAAADALRRQPAGTFVCRVSLSRPGALIVSIRLPAAHPGAAAAAAAGGEGLPRADGGGSAGEGGDDDGIAHVALGLPSLRQRRADSWLRAMPEATHCLDVCGGARVDKRRVLETEYMRLSGVSRAASDAGAPRPRSLLAPLIQAVAGAVATAGVEPGFMATAAPPSSHAPAGRGPAAA